MLTDAARSGSDRAVVSVFVEALAVWREAEIDAAECVQAGGALQGREANPVGVEECATDPTPFQHEVVGAAAELGSLGREAESRRKKVLCGGGGHHEAG